MDDFIKFVTEASEKPEMSKSFINTLKNATPEKLSQWFKDRLFNVPVESCKKILAQKEFINKNGTITISDSEPPY